MKICIAPRMRASDAVRLPECDVALLGFDFLGDVDYESELSGKTDKFGEFSRLTKSGHCAAVCGCRTDSRGLKRKSAAVADCGKLLGISDMLHVVDGDGYKSGAFLGIYRLGGYKVGVCIDSDLYFPENIKSFSLCGCNLLLCIMESVSDNMPPLLARAYAYLYGMPVAMSAGGRAYFADITGGIASSGAPQTFFVAEPRNNYRVVSTRERGLCPSDKGDY